MPFTEDDLRAVLADRSEAAPARTSLAATIETRGRTIRRRRRTAGALLTAAAVSVALLGPGTPRGPENRPAASQTVKVGRPVDVDPSVFRLALTSGRWAGALTVPYDRPGDLANVSHAVVIGTVDGYQEDILTGGDQRSVLMTVSVDRILKGTLTSRSVLVDLGFEQSRRTFYRYADAAPSGARVMLFLDQPSQQTRIVFPPKNPQSMVFEDVTADGPGLVGGFTPLSGQPWTTPKTLEELAASFNKP